MTFTKFTPQGDVVAYTGHARGALVADSDQIEAASDTVPQSRTTRTEM